MTRILLIRHGETAGNADRVVQVPETPLSERGLAQADRLARRLAGEGVVGVLSSDLARARMTAEAVARATGAPLVLEPLLQERNFGALRGTPYAELAGDLFAPDLEPAGGESWDAFHARADRAWEAVCRQAAGLAGTLAVVTHGLVCDAFVTRRIEVFDPGAEPAPAGGRPLAFGNTALTEIEGPAPWRVRRLACLRHLEAGDGDRGLSGL